MYTVIARIRNIRIHYLNPPYESKCASSRSQLKVKIYCKARELS